MTTQHTPGPYGKASFTPGPWTVTKDYPPNAPARMVIVNKRGEIVASLMPGPNAAQANARLIASCPALLEAAVAVREWLLANRDVPDDGKFHDYPKFEQPIAVLNAAIAQANGGA